MYASMAESISLRALKRRNDKCITKRISNKVPCDNVQRIIKSNKKTRVIRENPFLDAVTDSAFYVVCFDCDNRT
jgi:hypothetical protein